MDEVNGDELPFEEQDIAWQLYSKIRTEKEKVKFDVWKWITMVIFNFMML